MTDIFISSENILSPIGLTTAENFSQLKKNISGIKKQDDIFMSEQPFYASLFNDEDIFLKDEKLKQFTKFEKLLITSINDALKNSSISILNKQSYLRFIILNPFMHLIRFLFCNVRWIANYNIVSV